ncbi:MAG: metallophosphoesterase [Clostridia bacterium]|nr:metallophosphoesterase [Clostridia bacterium]
MKKKLFVVTDVHGHYTLLMQKLREAGYDKNNEEHLLISLGDHFDRGEESLQVLRFFRSLERKVLIRGNHEDLIELAFSRGYLSPADLHNGTDKTIRSFYGKDAIDHRGTIDVECTAFAGVLAFIHGTADYFETENYIFTHGWLPARLTDQGFVLDSNWRTAPTGDWRRARFVGWEEAYPDAMPDKTVVCGHHPCAYGAGFDNNRNWRDYSPFFGKGLIAMDASTYTSGEMNVLVLEDEVKEPALHEMTLDDEYFEAVKEGSKKVEMRLYDEKRKRIAPLDRILFKKKSDGQTVEVLVTGKHRYPDFVTLVMDHSPIELGFPHLSRLEIAEKMESIYSKEKISRYGALALSIALC